jgi:hypothetical protein
MSTQFKLLIKKLESAIKKSKKNELNTLQCQIETEIIGYLLGRKIAQENAEYVPEDLSKYPTLPLVSLNRVAKKAFHELQEKQKDKQEKLFLKVLSEPQRA